jgi:dTDP-4-dehydrorhamnose reductase
MGTINKKKTVLVTGATGMLGLKLCTVLAAAGYRVENGWFDISSALEVNKISHKLKQVDTIVHCAAMTEVNKCEENKKLSRKINHIGTKNIVNLAKLFGSNLIYISTPMVFFGKTGNYKETSRTEPVNHYAETKLAGEAEVLKYQKGLALRVNPIGVRPPHTHPSFIQWFVDAAKNNKSFTLFTDVNINPISTSTLANVICQLIENFTPGVLHLGSRDVVNKATIWREIVSNFPTYSGLVTKKPVSEATIAQIAKRPREMWLNISKAVSLGFVMPRWKAEVNTVLKELGVI